MYLGFKHYKKHLINMDWPPMKYISKKLCLKCSSLEEKKVLNMHLHLHGKKPKHGVN